MSSEDACRSSKRSKDLVAQVSDFRVLARDVLPPLVAQPDGRAVN